MSRASTTCTSKSCARASSGERCGSLEVGGKSANGKMGHDTMDMIPPQGYSVRPVRPEDAREIVALMAACDLAETGQMDAQSEEDLLSGWQALDMERGSWMVRSPQGELVAYATVHPHRGGRIDGDVYLLPAHCGRDIGTWLTRE